MFGLGGSELAVIALLALIVLGPARLPQLARAIARGYREFARVRKQVDVTLDELKRDMKLDAELGDLRAPLVGEPSGRRVPLDQLHAVEPARPALDVASEDDYLNEAPPVAADASRPDGARTEDGGKPPPPQIAELGDSDG